MSLKTLFCRNASDPTQRYIRYDGSSAYANGWQQMTQRFDVRFAAMTVAGYVLLKAGINPDIASGMMALLKAVPAAAGGMLAGHGLVRVFEKSARSVSFAPTDFSYGALTQRIYDVTGHDLSQYHLDEIANAKRDFPLSLTSFAIGGGLSIAYVGVLIEAGAKLPGVGGVAFTILGAAGAGALAVPIGGLGNVALRSWQIKNETITRIDDELPKLPEKQKAAVPAKAVFAPAS